MSGAKLLLPSMSSWREEGIHRFRRVRKIAKSDHELRHVCLSIRMEKNSAFTGRKLKKFGIWVFLKKNLSRKFKLH